MRAFHENPFWVLQLEADASLVDIRRSARKLAQLLRAGSESAKYYDAPGGQYPRTEELIRWSESALEDDAQRIAYGILSEPVEARRFGTSSAEPRKLRWWEK